jgi:hypothetical protein
MHCLYCNKRLGLFSFKKKPFCSSLHEVAYHDEQSGLALRRVMDPTFAVPERPPAIPAAPDQTPVLPVTVVPLEAEPFSEPVQSPSVTLDSVTEPVIETIAPRRIKKISGRTPSRTLAPFSSRTHRRRW